MSRSGYDLTGVLLPYRSKLVSQNGLSAVNRPNSYSPPQVPHNEAPVNETHVQEANKKDEPSTNCRHNLKEEE